jgi:hypothetical protein
MRNYLPLIFLVAYGSLLAQNPSNLFRNGSFDGVKGEDSHGEHWEVGSTPDLNDTSGNVNTSSGYSWVKKPLPSHNGGTWQNLYSDREYLEQQVHLEIGKAYTILFEYASQGIEAGTYRLADPAGISIYINNEWVFTTPDDKTPYTWENICYQFVAKGTDTMIRFSASDEQYVGIDGVKLFQGHLCNRTP